MEEADEDEGEDKSYFQSNLKAIEINSEMNVDKVVSDFTTKPQFQPLFPKKDIPTRWDSTRGALARFVQLQRPLLLFAADYPKGSIYF